MTRDSTQHQDFPMRQPKHIGRHSEQHAPSRGRGAALASAELVKSTRLLEACERLQGDHDRAKKVQTHLVLVFMLSNRYSTTV